MGTYGLRWRELCGRTGGPVSSSRCLRSAACTRLLPAAMTVCQLRPRLPTRFRQWSCRCRTSRLRRRSPSRRRRPSSRPLPQTEISRRPRIPRRYHRWYRTRPTRRRPPVRARPPLLPSPQWQPSRRHPRPPRPLRRAIPQAILRVIIQVAFRIRLRIPRQGTIHRPGSGTGRGTALPRFHPSASTATSQSRSGSRARVTTAT